MLPLPDNRIVKYLTFEVADDFFLGTIRGLHQEGISQRKLAERMGIGYSVLNEILNARRPVTEKTAMMFEAALGVEAEPLMRLQMRYNVRIAQKDKSFMQRLDNIRKIAAVL